MPTSRVFLIPPDLDLSGAGKVQTDLVRRIKSARKPVPLDLDSAAPTQVALQILFAAEAEAARLDKSLDLQTGAETHMRRAIRVTATGPAG